MEMKTFQISLTPNIGLKIENFLHLKIDDFSGTYLHRRDIPPEKPVHIRMIVR